MSIYAILDGSSDGGEQVASNTGWGDFRRWVESLGRKNHADLRHLVDFGWCQDLEDTEKQLDSALQENPPVDPNIADVGKALQTVLKKRGAAEVLSISDGFTK